MPFLLINPLVPAVYWVGARFLRKRLSADKRLHTIHDLVSLLGISLLASLVCSTAGTLVLLWSKLIPRADYWQATFNWWMGDAVALFSITPLLLEFALPRVRAFLGQMPEATGSPSGFLPVTSSGKTFFENIAFLSSLLVSFFLVFANSFTHSAHLFYLLFLPMIWIATRRGLRGAMVGLLLLDSCLAISMSFARNQLDSLPFIQFMMLILSLTALLLGGIIEERREAETALVSRRRTSSPDSRVHCERHLRNRSKRNMHLHQPRRLALARFFQ